MEDKILVSACLLGIPCRFDGKSKKYGKIIQQKNLIPFCPEVAGGLPTPRVPSEIKNNKVYNKNGEDVTGPFLLGAQKTLEFCQENGITKAILKSNSPSCGKDRIYDGTFSGELIDGQGITAKLLIENGITVIDENEFLEGVQFE